MEAAAAFVREGAALAAGAEALRARCEEMLALLGAELAARASVGGRRDGGDGDADDRDEAGTRDARAPEADPATLVSVAQHVHVQVLLETLLCWAAYPYLALAPEEQVFGAGPRNPAAWGAARSSPASLHLDEAVRGRGFEVFFGDRELCARTFEVLEDLCKSPAYGHFLQERYLGDRCLLAEALGRPVLEDIRPTTTRASGLLRALQLQSKYAQALASAGKAEDSARQRALRASLGKQISALVPRRGGVLAVMTTMLTNVPHGNIQAFQRVSGLLIQHPRNRPAVAGQIVDLIRGSLRDTDKARGALVRRSAVMTVNALACVDGLLVASSVVDPLVKALGEPSNETAILQALEFARILLASAPPDPELVTILEAAIALALELLWFASENHCRGEGEAQALVRLWLDYVDPAAGARLLRRFAAVAGPPGWYAQRNSCRLALRRTPSGGPVLMESLADESDEPAGEPRVTLQIGSRDARDEGDDDTWDANDESPRLLTVLKLAARHARATPLQNSMFAQSLEGLASILDKAGSSSALDPQVAADVAMVQGLLEGTGKFTLSRDHTNVETVAHGIARLLRGCAHALGLMRHEDQAENTDRDSGAGAMFALEIAPVALAMAASLASSETNAELWPAADAEGASEDKPFSRFRVLEQLLSPLAALGRMDDPDVVSGVLQQQQQQQDQEERVRAGVQALAAEIAELSSAVRVAILTTPTRAPGNGGSPARWSPRDLRKENEDAENAEEPDIIDPIGRRIAEADEDLKSKDPPMRAMGLDKLCGVIAGPLRPSEPHFVQIVDTLVSTLQDEDSYVYLTCVRAISTACARYPRDLFPKLVDLLLDTSAVPITVRIRIGEALASSARRAGELLPVFAPQLIRAFCLGASGRTSADARRSSAVDTQGRYRPPASRKSAEVEAPEELLAMYRTSCLSNLADVSAQAPWAAFQHARGIVALAKGVLTFDKSESARRAAAYVLLKVVEGAASVNDLRGLHEIPDELREAMRIINDTGDQDADRIVRFHCDRARGALDALMRRFAFPDQREKVLHVGLGLDKL